MLQNRCVKSVNLFRGTLDINEKSKKIYSIVTGNFQVYLNKLACLEKAAFH